MPPTIFLLRYSSSSRRRAASLHASCCFAYVGAGSLDWKAPRRASPAVNIPSFGFGSILRCTFCCQLDAFSGAPLPLVLSSLFVGAFCSFCRTAGWILRRRVLWDVQTRFIRSSRVFMPNVGNGVDFYLVFVVKGVW